MSEVEGLGVLVAGAGAIGSVCALILARQGARVTLADPVAVGDNASGVAAGMLAPVSEALLDPKSQDHLPLLRAAHAAWGRLLPDLASAIDHSGAVIETAAPEALQARAAAMGATLETLDPDRARRLCPGLAPEGPFVFTPEDARVEPGAMLAALHAALLAEGGAIVRSTVESLPARDVTIRATGPGPGLTPIKGQILRFPGPAAAGAVMRGEGIYVAPSSGGLVAGATMEEGRSDREVDPEAVERLRQRAVRLFPALDDIRPLAAAGVRAATPDGLPLVGPDGEAGIFIARGARRNGWLLAPLIAEVLIERLSGPPRSAAAAAFDPARFR